MDRQKTDKGTDEQPDGQRNRQTDEQIERKTNRWIEEKTSRRTNGQTVKQTDRECMCQRVLTIDFFDNQFVHEDVKKYLKQFNVKLNEIKTSFVSVKHIGRTQSITLSNKTTTWILTRVALDRKIPVIIPWLILICKGI